MLKIESEMLLEEARALKRAIEEFRPFGENGFTEEIASVKGMHAEFIPVLIRILRNMDDRRTGKFLSNLEKYATAVEQVAITFQEEVDQSMAKKLGGR